MQIRLARFHFTSEWEKLLGLERDGPGSTGETVNTWRLAPGMYPRGYGLHPWGDPGVISVHWDEARPMVWDVDLRAHVAGAVGVFASGVLLGERCGWRYYAPPGGDAFLLAGVLRGTTMSLVGCSRSRFPAVLPEQAAESWIRAASTGPAPRELLGPLPVADRTWFRSTRIANPDAADIDDAGIVSPLLD